MTNKKPSNPYILMIVGLFIIGLGFALSNTNKPAPELGIQNPYPALDNPAAHNTVSSSTESSPVQNALQAAESATNASKTAGAASETKLAQTPTVAPIGNKIGSDKAPVKIIEFASLTCSHCAHFHNNILDSFRVKYVDTGLVQIEFREFPLNKPALDATKLLHCLPASQYYPFMSVLFQTQSRWAFSQDYLDRLKQNAKLAGLSEDRINKCLTDKKAEEELAKKLQADVDKYKVDSTPTFIINEGQAVIDGAQDVDAFTKVIDPLLSGRTGTPSTQTTDVK